VAPLKTLSLSVVRRVAFCSLNSFRAYSASSFESLVLLLDGFHRCTYWLNQSPSQWEMFVANPISVVQTLLPGVSWRHVPTQTNLADSASRGLAADMFEKHNLW